MSSFLAPISNPVTLVGCCHCKANKYTIHFPELKKVSYCQCSICALHDFLWLSPEEKDVMFERTGPISVYECGLKRLSFEFCSTCGCQIRATFKESGARIYNARLLQDVDLWNLERDRDNDGAAEPPHYQRPAYKGPALPIRNPASGDDKLQDSSGSCHCGAVTLAMRTSPLSEQVVNECNCSFCWRRAGIHVYPITDSKSSVHISGFDSLQAYRVTQHADAFSCKSCGTFLFLAGVEIPEGAEKAEREKRMGHALKVFAVNVRALHGVDAGEVNTTKYDGRSEPPLFVVA